MYCYIRLLMWFATCASLSCNALGQFLLNGKGNSRNDNRRVIGPDINRNWFGLSNDLAISSNGLYAAWTINNEPIDSSTIVVSSIKGNWRREMKVKFGSIFFSKGSDKYFVWSNNGLCIGDLGGGQLICKSNVSWWQHDGTGRWLAWRDSSEIIVEDLITGRSLKLEALNKFSFDKTGQWLIGDHLKSDKRLVLCHLARMKTFQYDSVEDYKLKEDGRVLLLRQITRKGLSLSRISLPDGESSVVYTSQSGEELTSYALDNSGLQVTFTLRKNGTRRDGQEDYSHWSYKVGQAAGLKLVDGQTAGISPGLRVGSTAKFSKDGRYLLFYLYHQRDTNTISSDSVKVEVWSYHDDLFYTRQSSSYSRRPYPAVVSVTGGKVIQLVKQGKIDEYEWLDANRVVGDFALLSKKEVGDRFWEYARDSFWLVSLKDGTQTLLPFVNADWIEFDKTGKFLTCFDAYRGRHYYQYDVVSGVEQKLTIGVPDWTLGVENPSFIGWEETEKKINPVIAARTTDNALLVYDSYDLWKIDLTGKSAAINITNGYGRKHKVVFRLAQPENTIVEKSTSFILTAFSEENKSNGFYRKNLSTRGDPDSLFMGPYFFSHRRLVLGSWMTDPYGTGMLPLKASESEAWIVRRESATDAPNYFITENFRSFKPLTNLQPQKGYNWVNTELVNFIQGDGVQNQGVLFKPADFDSSKRYPVLFYYYEQFSSILNKFIRPMVSETGKPNIPWYVSRGYLVFTPDHYFQKGWRSKSTLLAMEGAAHELMKRSYVDGKRMGIMGTSQAGEFTTYILTHSSMFAAGFAGCGVSDLVGSSLSYIGINGDGGSRLGLTEWRIGSNMWEKPEQWVGESPILRAHKMTAPLLISHNKRDGAVLFENAVKMFTALRRLNKKVWLLQYDEGGHGLFEKEGLDCAIRLTQFFDHYLKGAPPPRWMTLSMPAWTKGVEDGLELDTSGRIP